MDDVRTVFLDAGAAMLAVLDRPEVAARWDAPSALPGMTIGALAAHTARAVLTVETYLNRPAPAADAHHVDGPGYVLAVMPDSDRDNEVNVGVRERADTAAGEGPDTVHAEAANALAALRPRLEALPDDAAVAVRDGIAIGVDDYLVTRVVEMVVHGDDLAASLGMSPDDLHMGEHAGAITVWFLAEVARRRTSTSAMVRALARVERADEPRPRAF